MKHKFFVGIIICLISSNMCHAQEGDYMKMRDKLAVLGGGSFDTATLFNAHRKLVKPDTTIITAHKNEYFKDRAWSYYKLAGHLKDSNMMENSIYYFRRAYQMDNKDFMSQWNLCNALSVNKHCNEMEELIPSLKAIIPRKIRKDMNIEDLLKSCNIPGWWFKQ